MDQEKKIFTLSEVCESIRKTISSRYGSPFWLRAEMHKLNYYEYSGHCFPDLCQKEGDKIVAEIRSTLWKQEYLRLSEVFVRETGEEIREGIELLMQVFIKYDPKYGLSLHIIDIDTDFTIGKLRKQRLECVNRLKKENLWGFQKTLDFPLLPKRLAVVSAVSSKGFSDFMQVINRDTSKYCIITKLFTAILQGENATESIPAALESIKAEIENYDVVVILRGGGGDVGLSCFDTYPIAASIAGFPIPILTGIGHSTNFTVSEEVSYFNAITPTQLGDYILSYFEGFDRRLSAAAKDIETLVTRKIGEDRVLLNKLKFVSLNGVQMCKLELQNIRSLGLAICREYSSIAGRGREQQVLAIEKMVKAFGRKIIWEKRDLEQMGKWMEELDPKRILKRGYSLVYSNDKIVKETSSLKEGQSIKIRLREGEIEAVITKLKK